MSAKVRTFIDFLVEHFEKHGLQPQVDQPRHVAVAGAGHHFGSTGTPAARASERMTAGSSKAAGPCGQTPGRIARFFRRAETRFPPDHLGAHRFAPYSTSTSRHQETSMRNLNEDNITRAVLAM